MSVQDLIYAVDSHYTPEEVNELFDNPVFIVSAPRSGSTLLYSVLSKCVDFWTIGGESHGIFAQFPHLKGENAALDSGRLSEMHADETTCRSMRALYLALLRDREGKPFLRRQVDNAHRRINFLEKTPRNSLNIPFLLKVFPRAKFIYLHREPKENISSIIEAWGVGRQTGQFVTFRNLPDWPLSYWCFLLPPGWKNLKGRGIAEIAAFQWQASNEIVMDDLSKLPESTWIALSYRDLIHDPYGQIKRLCEFSGVAMDSQLEALATGELPISASTITLPGADKWKKHEDEIMNFLPELKNTINRIESLSHGKFEGTGHV